MSEARCPSFGPLIIPPVTVRVEWAGEEGQGKTYKVCPQRQAFPTSGHTLSQIHW